MTEVKFWRGALYVLAILLSIVFVLQVWSVLLPFMLGLAIAYLIHPLVDNFVSIGFRRDRTVIVLYLILLGAAAALGFFLLPDLFRETDAAIKAIRSYTDTFNTLVAQVTTELRSVLHHVIGKRADSFTIPFRADRLIDGLLHNLPENLLNVLHIGLWIIIVPFVSFFALAQGRRWIDMLFEWTPSEYVESLLGLMAEINATLGGYIRGQMLDAMCVGSLTTLGLLVLRVDGAVLLGVITGLLNVVPYMAPVVGGSLALLTGYFQGVNPSVLYGIILLYGLIRIFDDFIFLPFVVGPSVSLHPIVMLFAVLAGVHVGGFFGLVVAIPSAAILKVIMSIALRNRRERMLVNSMQVMS